jgi:hypothetical protein
VDRGRSSLKPRVFKAGDRVIWWKRIPGGSYVYPVQAVVIAITEKRITIQGEDDGKLVTRHVPRDSLQKQQGFYTPLLAGGAVKTTGVQSASWAPPYLIAMISIADSPY